MPKDISIHWIDSGFEPQNPPDPDYPHGIRLDLTKGASRYCFTELPYPAKRCGQYLLECQACGFSAIITTAGRPDDPRSVRLPCQFASLGK